MVVTYMRGQSHLCRSKEDVLELIDEAFRLHSVTGERGHHASHHFDLFARNHDAYLDDLI